MPVLNLLLILLVLTLTSMPAVAASGPAPILFTRFASADAFASGALSGAVVDGATLRLADGAMRGLWTSPRVKPGFGFTRLVASWNAETPGASQVGVEAQVTTTAGETSDWYVLGVWAADDALRRTSLNGQIDPLGTVDTDTLRARSDAFISYALRVRLERATPDDPSPGVRMLGGAASDVAYTTASQPSTPLMSDAMVELPVPPLSQEVHARQYPQWGGGGEAWCSPTSTQMVIAFWGRGPAADDLAWVDPSFADPGVDFAAKSTYDAAYRGTGNWPFNAAYAARFGLDAFVTQLRSLAEAERFLRAGVPLVASIAARPAELEGFLFAGGTNGHLVVIVGFDASGNPIVNDPAARSNSGVRRVYDRAQFERVWLRGSSGTVYVIHPPEVALPDTPTDATPNW